MPRLSILSGPHKGQEFSFSSAVVIGRGAYADIRIDDPTVSRRHAEIVQGDDGAWRLRDLGSANGILHGGSLLRGELIVGAGVEVVIGEVEVRLSASDVETRPEANRQAFPELVERIELLAWITAVPSRREPAASLIGLMLETLLQRFPACLRIGVWVRRPGSDRLSEWTHRSREDLTDAAPQAELAEACLRHVDGVAGGKSVLEPLGLHRAPACILAAPLVLGGETRGVFVAEAERADTWQVMDRSLAKAIASVLASLVDAELGSHPDRRIAERDLLLARRVQQHFLPPAAPRLGGYQLAEAYVPARVVGGDHYDYFRFADDRVGLVIADVAGKAVSAALVQARFGMAVRLLASHAATPLDLLVTLNVLLLDELEPGMFVTAQVLALDPVSGRLDIANAGHPPPLLRMPDGQVGALMLEPGAPLGASAQTQFNSLSLNLEPGACLLLYSDGLDEAENEQGEAFGRERAAGQLAQPGDAPAVLAALNAELARFCGKATANDDLSLVVLSRDR